MISNDLRLKIIDRADIVDVVSDYVQLGRKSGSCYKACCPFHHEKTPSFTVSPGRNTWHCFGACQEGGDAISFVMKAEGLDYVGAMRHLAKKYNIDFEEREPSPEELEAQRKREALLYVNEAAQQFFTSQLMADNVDAKTAYRYAEKRWTQQDSTDAVQRNYLQEAGIGYAPKGNLLYQYAKQKGLKIEFLLELGLLKKNEERGTIYDHYRNRITIPIRDRWSRIIGFTARALDDEYTAKYLNSDTSDIFDKGTVLFGIDIARKEIIRQGKAFLVEGGPDVLKLQMLGILNTVGALGGAWRKEHFDELKKMKASVCFLPDADPPKADGSQPGTAFVIKNGRLAMECGLDVKVREIPLGEDGSKQDPDSYIQSAGDIDLLKEEPFVIWAARKTYNKDADIKVQAKVINDICSLVILEDEQFQMLYLEELGKMFGKKNLWKQAINEAKKKRAEKQAQSKSNNEMDLLHQYGFYIKHNCYWSTGKDGDERQWSNFTMNPLFHIKDSANAKRVFEVTNEDGYSCLVEMKMEEMVSLQKFQQRIEGLGNYIWMVGAPELTNLKKFLYSKTDSATEVKQLGWQDGGFWAWGNGILYHDKMWDVDRNGIVHLQVKDDNGKVLENKGNWFLPAKSDIYRNETQLFKFERKFVHNPLNDISLFTVAEKMIRVFGDNAKVAIAYLLGTLFRDIIVSYANYPILNCFGPLNTGKSELCINIMSFFIIDNKGINLSGSTLPGLADAVAQCSNACVHIDEYKNDIPREKCEFLKGLWDGVGRSRMNMDLDKKREMTPVKCGVLLTGQEMATADVALFSRFVFLQFPETEHTPEDVAAFHDLVRVRRMGYTHITNKLLGLRDRFAVGYAGNFREVMETVRATVDVGSNDRIVQNWVAILAAFKTLCTSISLPFDYDDLYKVCVEKMKEQCGKISFYNEIAVFWKSMEFMMHENMIQNWGDYRIKEYEEIKTSQYPEGIRFKKPKRILFVRPNQVLMLYKKVARTLGDTPLPEASLRYYLTTTKDYLGTIPSMAFKRFRNGVEMREITREKDGKEVDKRFYTFARPLIFDYDAIAEKYSINLEEMSMGAFDTLDDEKQEGNGSDEDIPF